MYYVPIFLLPILILMVIVRAQILRKHGIKAIVFGRTNKSDFVIIPIVLCFFYFIITSVFDLPFPEVFKRYFWHLPFLHLVATGICLSSLIWFFITLKTFGRSFRVGIDINTKDDLITNGVFSISRNPIYLAFITFFIGIFLAYPNIGTVTILAVFMAGIHRQILREEKFLKGHYGNDYITYCDKVRRYL